MKIKFKKTVKIAVDGAGYECETHVAGAVAEITGKLAQDFIDAGFAEAVVAKKAPSKKAIKKAQENKKVK